MTYPPLDIRIPPDFDTSPREKLQHQTDLAGFLGQLYDDPLRGLVYGDSLAPTYEEAKAIAKDPTRWYPIMILSHGQASELHAAHDINREWQEAWIFGYVTVRSRQHRDMSPLEHLGADAYKRAAWDATRRAFELYGLLRLHCACRCDNERSQRWVVKHCGYQKVSERPYHHFLTAHGEPKDCYIYTQRPEDRERCITSAHARAYQRDPGWPHGEEQH